MTMSPVRPIRVWRIVNPAPTSTMAVRSSGSASSIWKNVRCFRAEKPAASSRAMKAGNSQIGTALGVPKLSRIWSREDHFLHLDAFGFRDGRSGIKSPFLRTGNPPSARDEQRAFRLDAVRRVAVGRVAKKGDAEKACAVEVRAVRANDRLAFSRALAKPESVLRDRESR